MRRSTNLNSANYNFNLSFLLWAVSIVALACLLTLDAAAQNAAKKPATSAAKERTFATPQEAADALIDAAEKFDVAALEAIPGPDGRDIIHTGEDARDREQAAAFAAQAREKKQVAVDRKLASRAFLSIGPDEWPFPVPIVKKGGRWSFDSKAGR